MPLQLSTPVKFIKRVGERIATNLAERGVTTVEDLLYHLPFRYEDRLHPKPLSLYHPGDMASLIGEVRGTTLLRTRSGPIFEMTIGITPPDPNSDAAMQGLLAAPPPIQALVTRSPSPSAQDILETVKCMWFHGTYLKDKFHPGQKIALYGKLEGSRSGNALNAPPGSTRFKMIQPTFEILPDAHATGDDAEFTMLEMGRIVPVYESLGGKTPWGAKLTSRWLRRVLWTIFKDLAESEAITQTPSSRPEAAGRSGETPVFPPDHTNPAGAPSVTASSSRVGSHDVQLTTDTLPTALRNRLAFPTRMEALRDLHFPPAGTSMTELMSARTPAHRRLIFEEFFYLELGLELKRRRLRERQGTAFVTTDQVREALKQVLPFKPTAAQKRVLGEIVHDMRRPQPMRRLLQGDVGSGKTIVAFQAALIAIENGYQVALMAPTEILATQHYLSARKLLSEKISPRTRHPYRVALLTGSLDERTKRETRARLFRGEVDLAIGTHALVEDKVDFANLGLVIVDEQHRFGVQQRFQLTRKPNTGAATQTTLVQPQKRGAPSMPTPGPEQAVSARLGGTAPSSEWVGENQAHTAMQSDIDQPQDSGDPSSPMASSSAKVGSQNADTFSDPDVLVMTATPIPRTLALTLYGDLEASVIDELPPGRTPIQTRRMPEERSAEVWDFVRKQVAAGRQAYIVYPIIEGDRDDQPELDFASDLEASDTTSESSLPPQRATSTLSSRLESAATGVPIGRSLPEWGGVADAAERPAASLRAAEDPSLSSDQRSTADSATASAPTARPYTSLGQRPRLAPKRNGRRAEGPASSGPPTHTKARTKPQRTKLRSATEMHAELQQGPLAGLKLGLLHGRMSADDKEVTMARFKRGELDVLVSTTVIEVGVDVPNATVMVIEHADRFGLAQLHQLRGRVGRGAAKSYCVLISAAAITPEADLRLNAMVQTQDGFALAELDLQQRGPGEFFGTRQAGLPDLRVANLARDRDLLELAKTEAARFAEQEDPNIPRAEIEAVWSRLKQQWQRRYGLLEA